MSKKHPIVAITGSSGAGTSTVLHSFRHIFRREKIRVQIIHGDSFHRFTRDEMATDHDAAATLLVRGWSSFSVSAFASVVWLLFVVLGGVRIVFVFIAVITRWVLHVHCDV